MKKALLQSNMYTGLLIYGIHSIFQFRASIRTFNPQQLKYEDKSDIKFKHSVFMRNMNRVKAATAHIDLDAIGKEIA